MSIPCTPPAAQYPATQICCEAGNGAAEGENEPLAGSWSWLHRAVFASQPHWEKLCFGLKY